MMCFYFVFQLWFKLLKLPDERTQMHYCIDLITPKASPEMHDQTYSSMQALYHKLDMMSKYNPGPEHRSNLDMILIRSSEPQESTRHLDDSLGLKQVIITLSIKLFILRNIFYRGLLHCGLLYLKR